MLHINNHEITGIYRGLQEISEVYKGPYLVWAKVSGNPNGLVLCCFSNGYWIDEYPWIDETPWVDQTNT